MPSQKCDRSRCNNPATHTIINRDCTPIKKLKLCCEDYIKFIKEESKEYLIRNCSSCGKRMRIRLYDDGHYSGGHYFGSHRPPLKISKNPTGSTRLFGKKVRVYRALKYGKAVEDWECNECYNGPEKK